MENYTLAQFTDFRQLEDYVQTLKPDVTVVYHAPLFLSRLNPHLDKVKASSKLVLYVPIEGYPLTVDTSFFEKADLILVPSKFSQECLAKEGFKGEILPHGVDTEVFKPLKPLEEKYAEANPFKFGTVASMVLRKMITCIVDAYATALSRGMKNTEYYLTASTYDATPWDADVNVYARKIGVPIKISRTAFLNLPVTHQTIASFYNQLHVHVLTASECLTPETPVNTGEKLLQVKDVPIGSYVFTRGGLRKVIKFSSRFYKGEIIYIQPVGDFHEYGFTPDHLILSVPRTLKWRIAKRGEAVEHIWREAKNFQVGDLLVIPRFKEEKDLTISVKDYLAPTDYVEEGDLLYPMGRNRFATFKHPNASPLPKIITIDKELCRLIGAYVSEGCISEDGIIISNSDRSFLQSIADGVSKVLPITYYFTKNKKAWYRTVYNLVISNSLLKKIFAELFGRKAKEKRLPTWIIYLRSELIRELLFAYLKGDGCIGERSVRFSSTSLDLLNQIRNLLLKIGIVPSIYKREFKKHPTWRHEYTLSVWGDQARILLKNEKEPKYFKRWKTRTYSSKDYIYVQVRKIRKAYYAGEVYDLTVEDEHEFGLPFIVHNSFGLIHLESMACGTVPLTIKHGGALETVGDCGLYVSPKAFIATSMGRFAIPDTEELAEKMAWASQNPDKLERLAEKAVERAKAFTWENVVGRLNELFKRVAVNINVSAQSGVGVSDK